MMTTNTRTCPALAAVFLTGFLSLVATTSIASPVTIDKPTAATIASAYAETNLENFDHFLNLVETDKRFTAFADAVGRYRAGKALPEAQQNQLFRLLGIYTRLKYGNDAIETLRQLVTIPTFRVDDIPPHENPHIIKIGKAIEQLAKDFNLDFFNADNRVFVVSLGGSKKGKGGKTKGGNIALHAHADIVPVNKSAWVLEDGTQLDPFVLTTIGNRMYGRGAEDDKNGIVVTLYAMKVIKEEGLPLFNSFKLLVDTTEESLGNAIPYYLERHPTPEYNLALDGGYPVVIAEKGYGTVMANFPVRKGKGQGAEFISLTGGLATNQIPSSSKAVLVTNNAKALKAKLDKLASNFIATHGDNFTIESQVKDRNLLVSVNGVSAHSSSPGSGINPVSRMLVFIDLAQQELDIKTNHITDAARYASDNWGLDYHGKVLGINFEHDFMGPLTTALTYVNLDESKLQLAVNIRMPIGKTPDQLKAATKTKLDAWQKASAIDVTITHDQRAPMYRNPNGKWVNTLLDVAVGNLGIERKFGTSSGATSIHDLPNGVQFGLALESEKYTGHNANEFKTVDQFLLDLQTVTEMMVRLGSLEELQ